MPELGVEVVVVERAGIQHAGVLEAEVQVVEVGAGGFGSRGGMSESRGVEVGISSRLGLSPQRSAPVSAAFEAAGALCVPRVMELVVEVPLVM